MNDIWYIDTFDPRAGLGFVSLRGPEAADSTIIGETNLAAFIGPPAFTPELVNNRGVGFALTRGHGQVGLFREGGEEVGFKSLGAVAEFLRRAYVRRGSGDTPGEGGEGVPRLPVEGDGPPGISPFAEGPSQRDFVDAISKLVKENDQRSSKLAKNDSREAMRLDCSTKSPENIRRLARGAVRILIELFRRVPNSTSTSDFELWLRTFSRFCEMIFKMGLCPLVHNELVISSKEFLKWLERQKQLRRLMPLLLDSFFSPDPHWWWYRSVYLASGLTQLSSDPFFDLAQLPVPPKTASCLPASFPTLQNLLSALIATPSEVLAGEVEEQAELAFFAAAYLNVGTDRPSAPFLEDFSSDIYKHFPELLVSRALSWLNSNLPNLIYETIVEEMIVSSSSLKQVSPKRAVTR